MPLIIYEDSGWENLQPLTLTRPVWELRCGITTLREKLAPLLGGAKPGYHCREHLTPLVRKRNPGCPVNQPPEGETLFLNGRVLFDNFEVFKDLSEDAAFYAGDELAAVFLRHPKIESGLPDIRKIADQLPRRKIKAEIAAYPWDLVEKTHHWIEKDLKTFSNLTEADPDEYLRKGVHIVPGKEVFIGEGVTVAPGVVLDSSDGPIYIGDKVRIMPHAVIIGPAAIGERSLVKIGAKIYPGTSIGPVCKVGGEIEETVIHGCSNKQHEGFLGHAYIGEWCNLGAGTENSDLKNNYTPVKVQIGALRVLTGKLFIGMFMGDHSKTGINTTFNTGSVVGVCSMAYGPGFQPRFIPSFHWSDGVGMKLANYEAAISTANHMMDRRGKKLSNEEAAALKHIYKKAGGK